MVSAQTKEEAAQLVAATLFRHAEGPHDCPHTWRAVAQGMGVRWKEYHWDFPSASRGEYLAASGDAIGSAGFIGINTAYAPREQAEAWVHELSHHLLNVWFPPQLHDAADVYSYADDRDDVRHEISRRVEELVVPVMPAC